MRLLGLDIGEKTIGVAVFKGTGQPRPLYTLLRSSRKRDLQHLRELVERYHIDRIVVGLPLNMDGTAGPAADRALFFAQWLEEQLERPTDTWDERLSTFEAEERLHALSLSPAQCAEMIDAMAAAVILEDYLRRKDAE